MSNKKYNHYVPKFYLSNFSGSNKYIDKCRLDTEQIIRKAPMDSTAGKDYLYGKAGKVENMFMQLEGKWASILKNIICTESLPTNPEPIEYLLSFLYLSAARTLGTAESTLNRWAKFYQIAAKMYRDHDRISMTNEDIVHIEAKNDIPNASAILNMSYILQICEDLKLGLIKNTSDMLFITSDSPAAKYNQFIRKSHSGHSFGYELIGFQLFLPIHPRYCLIWYDSIPYYTHRNARNIFHLNSSNEVKVLNRLFLNNADKEVYFSGDTSDRTINKLLPFKDDSEKSSTHVFGIGDNYLVYNSTKSCNLSLDFKMFSLKRPFQSLKIPSVGCAPVRPHVEAVEKKMKEKESK